MCGIIGMVGKQKNKIQSFNLATNLLRETKRRGRHATGFYSINLDGKPVFHKAPVSADGYVQTPEWKQNIHGYDALIGHARFTTNGAATINENNHPHVSKSGNLAVVHNGIIFDYETIKRKYKKDLISDCDSELILRIILRERDVLRGIKKVYELLGQSGDFACEVIHKNSRTNKITFYFFRDNGRPGKIIDARETLGQIIFCSEEQIWKDSVLKAGMSRSVRQLSIHNIPEYKILSIDSETLEVKEIDVEKPKFKTKHYPVSTYTSSYLDEDSYYSGYYGGANKSLSKYTPPKHTTGGIPKTGSVLGEGWTETINPETNLPRFVYDPSVNENISFVPESNQDSKFKELLKEAVKDKDMRWFGWQDEAFSYGLITHAQWESFSKKEIETPQNSDIPLECDIY